MRASKSWYRFWVVSLVMTLGAACSQSPKRPSAELEAVPALMTPDEGQRFAPALTRLAQDKANMSVLTEVDKCAACHAEITSEWRESMHAFSSMNNPLYALTLDDFIDDRDPEKARFCNGCHDVALLFDAKAAKPDPEDPRSHAGITCNTCHGITAATSDGNGSFTLSTSAVPYPNADDPQSLERHSARLAPAVLRTNRLCASCHRGFIGPQTGHPFVALGMDEFLPWRRSHFAGNHLDRIEAPAEARGCVGCHMKRVGGDRPHSSHRFPGGHITFAKMIGAEQQFEANRELLQSAAELDLIVLGRDKDTGPFGRISPADAVMSGRKLVFDVVISNRGTGHNFPGGARDLRDTWLQVSVSDATGKILATAGEDHLRSGADPTAHRLRSLVVSDEGEPVMEHAVGKFRVGVYDRTVPPGDVSIVRYSWTLPPAKGAPSGPLKISAQLNHRRVQAALQEQACANSRKARGEALLRATERLNGRRPQACITQPVVEVARAQVWLGPGSQRHRPASGAPMWRRMLTHARGLRHHLQEHLNEAELALRSAHRALPAEATQLEKAAVELELGATLGRMGRTKEAIEHLDKAQALLPEHPAIYFTRGNVFAQVWRWQEADRAYAQATRLAPLDDRAWRALAMARGSLGDRKRALEAAQNGLKLNPRDPHLLRSQSLAIAALNPGSEQATKANEVWLRYRRDDGAPAVKAKCKDDAPACQKERVPIFERPLHAPKP